MTTPYGSLENGTTFDFNGTESDFIQKALKSGLRVFGNGRFSEKVYLHTSNGDAGRTLLTIYRNEWLDKMSCSCVVSHAPLRELLERNAR